jgi:hypothetical protein
MQAKKSISGAGKTFRGLPSELASEHRVHGTPGRRKMIFHHSYKDTQWIAPYVPTYSAELRNRDWSDERVYRRAGIGANLLAGKTWRRSSGSEIIRKQRSADPQRQFTAGRTPSSAIMNWSPDE